MHPPARVDTHQGKLSAQALSGVEVCASSQRMEGGRRKRRLFFKPLSRGRHRCVRAFVRAHNTELRVSVDGGIGVRLQICTDLQLFILEWQMEAGLSALFNAAHSVTKKKNIEMLRGFIMVAINSLIYSRAGAASPLGSFAFFFEQS